MRNKILKGWNASRIIRLAIGIAIVGEGIRSRDTTLIIAGLVVSLLPVFNIGCCCGSSCEVPRSHLTQKQNDVKDVETSYVSHSEDC
jgi:hypothetical protein